MPLTLLASSLAAVAADWLIVPLVEGAEPTPELAHFDSALGGALARLRQAGDAVGKAFEFTPLYQPPGIQAARVLLIGLGPAAAIDRLTLIETAAAAARYVTDKPRQRLALALPAVPGIAAADSARAVGVGLLHGCQGPGVRKRAACRFVPNEIVLIAPAGTDEAALQHAARRADAEGRAVGLARELVNMPPCDLYPGTFAALADGLTAGTAVRCTILDETQLLAERMQALLAVARGSERPARLVVLHYQGAGGGRPLGFVGKGVTFDSGGLSLKDNDNMLDMKSDMAGAAAVLGALLAIAELGLPVDVLGVLALVENMPSGKAMKLGDVLHARNGTTIEVHNTDAEGRLILADALSYAVDQGASHLVDLATLTGACMVALGEDVAGVMGNNDSWLARVQRAADQAGERIWPLPMHPLYAERLKSDVADIKNVTGKRWGGAITAAKFLERFVGGVPWAHLDIAGPAWGSGATLVRDPGGTGFGVRTLVELAAT